jgi:hypothetical protein
LVAEGLDHPAGLAVDPHGALYVVQRGGDVLKFQRGQDLIARGFYDPGGILWFQGSLVLLSRGRLDALQDWDGDGVAERITPWAFDLASNLSPGNVLTSDGNRYVYFAVGTDCTTCSGTEQLRGTVLVLDIQTGRIPLFAGGTGELHGLVWLPESSPPMLVASLGGDDGTPGRLSKISAGTDLGWPTCLAPNPHACADRPGTLLKLEEGRIPTAVQALRRATGGWWLFFASYDPRQPGSGRISVVGLNPDGGVEGTATDLVVGLGLPVGLGFAFGGKLLVADMALGKILALSGLNLP